MNEDRRLAEMLRAAHAPKDIDPALNDRLVELALGDPSAEPSAEELEHAEMLRKALESTGSEMGVGPYAAFARALRAAYRSEEPDPAIVEDAVRRALSGRPKTNVIYLSFGVAAVAALAASVLLFVFPAKPGSGEQASERPSPAGALVMSRSTTPLFKEKFDTAATTLRIDRIAQVRSAELRSNHYALWGVR
jgi:hypothetical protein